MTSLTDLPPELLAKIARESDARGHISMMRASKYLHASARPHSTEDRVALRRKAFLNKVNRRSSPFHAMPRRAYHGFMRAMRAHANAGRRYVDRYDTEHDHAWHVS